VRLCPAEGPAEGRAEPRTVPVHQNETPC
jgi:hypothetical protein